MDDTRLTSIMVGNSWHVRLRDKLIAGPFVTNAEAWRWIDRFQHEPHNRKEAAHDWSAQQWLKGE